MSLVFFLLFGVETLEPLRHLLEFFINQVIDGACSLIADALTIRGIRVEHILGHAQRRNHVLTSWAQVTGNDIIYLSQDVLNKE